jgi:hypothetical protein
MTPTVEELYDGRNETVEGTITPKTVATEIAYVVQGVTDSDSALSTALANIPTTNGALVRKNVVLEEQQAESAWRVVARFADRDIPAETGESIYSFDTTGGTQHITQSITTVGRYGPEASNQLGGAIGYDGERVTGVDITVPVFAFTETHYLPDSTVDGAYKGTVFRLTGKVNDASFKGLAAGECLFLGASGTKRGEEDWEITFRFAAAPNKTGVSVGDIGAIDKKGWEYLWVQYGDAVDDIVNRLVQKPIAAYVEQVYEEADFSALGI